MRRIVKGDAPPHSNAQFKKPDVRAQTEIYPDLHCIVGLNPN